MRLKVAVIASALLLASAAPAFAYIDPGSGGMMMQLLLGGVAGLGVLLKMYWTKLTSALGFKRSKPEQS